MFRWDEKKSRENRKKHGFVFNEILEVFDDPHLHEVYDVDHSTKEEDRFKCLGSLKGFLIILVFVSERNGMRRIISARKATPKERVWYYDNIEETT